MTLVEKLLKQSMVEVELCHEAAAHIASLEARLREAEEVIADAVDWLDEGDARIAARAFLDKTKGSQP